MAFCSDDDGLLAKRKQSLLNKLKAACNTEDSAKFVKSVIHAVFDKKFISSHRWPIKK